MRIVLLFCLWVHTARSQNALFEEDLPVSLQPPSIDQAVPQTDFSVFIPDQSDSVQLSQTSRQSIPAAKHIVNPTVLFTAEQDSKLPSYLLNPFYKNHRIAEQLAKQSWFVVGENLVYDRETEKIPRDKIIHMLKSAGLARRRRFVDYYGYYL